VYVHVAWCGWFWRLAVRKNNSAVWIFQQA
jgi:hypothetical protein